MKLGAPEGKTSYRRTSRDPARFAEPGISGCLAGNSIRGPAGDSFFSVGISGWSRRIQTGPPQGLGRLQWVDATAGGGDYRKTWDRPLVDRDLAEINEHAAGLTNKARLEAARSPHSADWLSACLWQLAVLLSTTNR